MNIDLKQFGNIPITAGELISAFSDTAAPRNKLMLMENKAQIIRLKRGVYVVSPEISGKKIVPELIANHLYGHSYVSMQWALREYGLIPERVSAIKSMTILRSTEFENSIGRFVYEHCASDYYNIGITMRIDQGVSYLIASKEKALCDLVVSTSKLRLRSLLAARQYLEEDIRIDMDELKNMDSQVFRHCASVSKRASSLLAIANLIEKL